jgi:tRNA-specific 2-thiouridylase
MPVGEYTKEAVRQIAEDLDLINAAKPDSQDICFVARGFHGDFVAKMSGDITPGPMVDHLGNVVGEHRGLPYYTPGQRRQLGISTNVPYYVKKIDAATNTVIVAPEKEAMMDQFTIRDIVWQAEEKDSMEADFQLRYGNQVHPATYENGKVKLKTPLLGISPGQSAVAYSGDLVLMGGVIDRV